MSTTQSNFELYWSVNAGIRVSMKIVENIFHKLQRHPCSKAISIFVRISTILLIFLNVRTIFFSSEAPEDSNC